MLASETRNLNSTQKDFDLTVPIADVEIANYFREDYYLQYFATPDGKNIVGQKPDEDPPMEHSDSEMHIG